MTLRFCAIFGICSINLVAVVQALQSDRILKSSFDIGNGRQAKLFMNAPPNEQHSGQHVLVIEYKGGRQEVVWESRRQQAVAGLSQVDIDNEYVQLVAILAEEGAISFALSNVLGVDLIRVEKRGGQWLQLARGRAFSTQDRFTSIEFFGQGLLFATDGKVDRMKWLDANGQMRHFKSTRRDNVEQQPAREEVGTILWIDATGVPIELSAPSNALGKQGTLSRVREAAAGKANVLVRMSPSGVHQRFDEEEVHKGLEIQLRPTDSQ